MLFAGDLAGIGIRAAPHLRGADLTGVLQGLILGDAFAGGATIMVDLSPQEAFIRVRIPVPSGWELPHEVVRSRTVLRQG